LRYFVAGWMIWMWCWLMGKQRSCGRWWAAGMCRRWLRHGRGSCCGWPKAGDVRTWPSGPGCHYPLWTVGLTGTPRMVWPGWMTCRGPRRGRRCRPG